MYEYIQHIIAKYVTKLEIYVPAEGIDVGGYKGGLDYLPREGWLLN